MENQKQKLKLLENTSMLNLVIPRNVEDKIRLLCNRFPDNEWSGILFYKTKGSFDDGTFEATCLDICLMDVGSAAFTDFDDSPDIVSYRVNHPQLLQEGVYEGLIHSHDNMAAFFSGTDSSTLLQEGTTLNHFLSLIVNNDGNYVARITRQIDSKIKEKVHVSSIETTSYKTYNDETIVLEDNAAKEEDTEEEYTCSYIEYFNMNIQKATCSDVFRSLFDRISEVVGRKSKPVKTITKTSFNRDFRTPTKEVKHDPNIDIWGENDLLTKDARNFDPWYSEYDFQYGSYDPYAKIRSGSDYSIDKNKIAYSKDKMEEIKKSDKDLDESKPDELYSMESVPEQIVESMAMQILTGCPLIWDSKKLDLKKWVKTLDNKYDKRFKGNTRQRDNWLEYVVETVLGYTVDEDFESTVLIKYGMTDIEDVERYELFASLYAYYLIEYMKKLPKSEIKDKIIEILKTYMPL